MDTKRSEFFNVVPEVMRDENIVFSANVVSEIVALFRKKKLSECSYVS